MSKIIGIDLGTSNSAAAYLESGRPKIIPSSEGITQYGKAFPSYVALTRDGQRIVGEPARRQAITNAKGTMTAFKRKMGTDHKYKIFDKEYRPQELSAFILQKIKKDAEEFLGEAVEKAVITVPAYFNDNQRQATKDAGEIAGLEVVRLVNEPTAASLAYGLDKSDKELKILVFDLGGGTLDVTVMDFGGGVFEVKSTNGDTQLGGTDMDKIIAEYLADQFRKESGVDISNDKQAHELKPSDIDKIIMVGGPTRMPIVHKFVEDTVGKKAERGIDPMECVAMGAAIQAGVLSGEVKDILLLDVTPLSLGLETLGGVSTKLIEKNTTIPTKKSQVFSTAADMQTAVDIHILQGERPMAKDNVSLGKFTLVGIPPAARGVPQVEVTFDIDANGILHVSAKDKATNKEQSMRVTSPLKMSDDEIKAKMSEAEDYAEKDKQELELVQAKNEAESMIYVADKTVKDLKDKLSKDQFDKISQAKKKLEGALSEKDTAKIRAETENLQKALQEVGASAYQAAGPGVGGAETPESNEKGSEQEKKKDDGVVEGEYEKVDDDKK